MTGLLISWLLLAQADDRLLEQVVAATEPLPSPRGERLPLLLWPAHDPEEPTDALLRALDARGMVPIASWKTDARAMEEALELARAQKRLGLEVAINATALTYGFFDGDPSTAHVDASGERFFDDSFPTSRPMGCPFAIDHRLPVIAGRVRAAVAAYRVEALPIDFVFADWEIDGPLEWNGAWEHSKRCARCRAAVPGLDDFATFQSALREKRASLQRAMLAEPVLESYPDALVGNYGVYPNDGTRYWLDYFETDVPEAPHRERDGVSYRVWYPTELEESGFTFAMPVTYPWYRGFHWYDFADADYRWFYNMLLVGTNAARSTPDSVPLVTFVHWHTTEAPPEPDPEVRQMSRGAYRALLWHLLLRGHDALFLWSPKEEALEESELLHAVYRESHAFVEFLLRGRPAGFDVPSRPGTVVSARVLGERALVVRTDFGDTASPVVTLHVEGGELRVPKGEGPQVIDLIALTRRR